MNLRLLLITIWLFQTYLLFGQQFHYPAIAASGAVINDFIPPGWAIRDSAMGDLNGDTVADAALVLQYRDSVLLTKQIDDTVQTQPRMLAVLLQDNLGRGFILKEQSNTFILNHDDPVMDEPFYGMHIHNRVLTISFQLFYTMGSWYTTFCAYHFRLQKDQLSLIGADYSSIHRASMDYVDYSFNFLTRKRILIKGNEAKGTKQTSTKRIDLPRLKTLRELKSPFDWEVEKDIYL